MANPNLPTIPGYNTYVGARYVPKLGGEWLQSVAYEPLVIVTYQGNSYTSKTFVPANTPITNTEYWVETGNYNAQVEQYRQEVQTFDGRITNNSNNITILQNQNSNKHYIFIGDSYGVSESAGGTSWADIIKNYFPDDIYLIKGGTGFASDEYITDNWLSMLQNATITNTPTDIILIGGANDANLINNGTITQNTLASKISDFCQYV